MSEKIARMEALIDLLSRVFSLSTTEVAQRLLAHNLTSYETFAEFVWNEVYIREGTQCQKK